MKDTKYNIRKVMLRNHFKMFLLSITVLLIMYIILNISNIFVKGLLIKDSYHSQDYINDDYATVDYSKIADNGGGIAILDENLKVTAKEGLPFLASQSFTQTEWADFLMNTGNIDSPYSYSVAYNDSEDYWLIIAFPSSVRMMFSIYYNNNITVHDKKIIIPVLIALTIVFILLLYAITWLFTRSTTKTFINPIYELENSLISFKEGNYEARIDTSKKNILTNLAIVYNQMADKIQSQIKSRRDLILDVSHDIKNPLASTTGYCEYLINHPDLPLDKRMGYYKIIYNDSLRAVKLADDLFQLSNLETDGLKVNLEQTDICEFLREEIAVKIPILEQKQFEYDFNIPDGHIDIFIDKQLLSRVVDNLIFNAIKYNKEGTKITVTLRETESHVGIIFEDNGIGIPVGTYKDIKKPFVRGKNAYKHVQGSGLGLSIVDKIVACHNGNLLLDSNQDEGCKFTVVLNK